MDFKKLKRDLQWLRGEDSVVSNKKAIKVLSSILEPLLAAEGLELLISEKNEIAVDLFAGYSEKNNQEGGFNVTLGIDYKHHGYGNPIDIDGIDQLIVDMGKIPFERVMLIGRFGFTNDAVQKARSLEPINIELLDLNGIDAWIHRLEIGKPFYIEEVQILIRSISHEFAKLVSEEPNTLNHLEWRDLERMMARVMEGLGFECTLTPPAKDGGKDLILYWRANKGVQSFIVELKHWRLGKRVGKSAVSDFMSVIIAENRTSGLFLSTYGYTADKTEGLTQITRDRLRFGEKEKIVLLAKTYIRACSGLWSPPEILPEVLFEKTL